MYSKFPYTTYFNILKVQDQDQDSYKYVVELPFDRYGIYLYINKEILTELGLTFNEYFKKAVLLIDEIKADPSPTKETILNNSVGLTASEHYSWSENLFNDFGHKLIGEEVYYKYYIKDDNIILDPERLSDDELYNRDPIHFYKLNNYNSIIETNYFSEDELYNFGSTFFSQILEQTTFDYTDPVKMASNKYNDLYYKVIKYYINNKSDSVSAALKTILSGNVVTGSSTSSSSGSCGCASSGTASVDLPESCADKYTAAMKAWLSTMMSDIDNFYNVWFYTESVDDKGKTCYKVNTDLVNILIKLIDEFTELGIDLSFSTANNFHNCNCQDNAARSYVSDCNYKTINNFMEVLNLFLEDSVQANQNKIKTYGKAFGELLYRLYF